MRGRWAATAGLVACLMVGASTGAVAAAPVVPDQLTVERTATHTPVLVARVSDPDGGALSGQFFARRAGASTWDLLNGVMVTGTSGAKVRAALPALPAGARVEWTVRACESPSSCSPAATVSTTRVSAMLGAGARKGATTVPFQLGDRVSAQVDVGTGNLLITAAGLAVPGVSGDLDVGAAYNSLAVGSGAEHDAADSALGWGWTQLIGYGITLREETGGAVVYSGPAGLTGTFLPTGTGGYTAPAGITADLAQSSGGWTLTDHASASVLVFDTFGDLTEIRDRNGNAIVIAPGSVGAAGTVPASITGTAGHPTARVVHVDSAYDRIVGLFQTAADGTTTRTVEYGYTGEDLTSITDPLGRATTLTYVGHRPVRVEAPGGVTTHLAYDAVGRVTMVRQVNTTPGSPGDSITRFAYPTSTQTLVSDPSQEQAGSPSSGPRTTYSLTTDMTGRVAHVVDAQGRERSTTFSPHFDAATQTTGTGTEAGTTTNTYGANDGESLTEQVSPTGASHQWAYTGTTAATRYSPTSAIDAAGNESVYTYTGAGNPATTTDPGGAQAAVTYHPNGTVASATAPGNGTNATAYTYNNQAQLTQVTPVTGTTLGTRTYTWDAFGRLASETNGRAITTSYTYDANDRATGVDYSTTPASPDVAYTYDTAGQLTTRVDASGTTTYGHDQLGRLITRAHTAGGGTITYGYDKAGRLASTTDTRGTTSYAYDSAGALIRMTTQVGSKQTLTNFAVDDHGRRTDTWLATSPDNASWAAHSHTDYDTSGRIARITAQSRPDSTATPITEVDISYCYTTSTTAPTCTGMAQNDQSNLQWQHNHLTGQTTSYTYDTTNRLTGVNLSAGTSTDGDPLPAVSYTYAYDTRGNRTSQTVVTGTGAGATTTTQNLTYNAGNQITTTGYTYDGAGNQTTDPVAGTISYTAGDQMASVSRAGKNYTYTYAGTGNTELLAQNTPNATDYAYTYGRTASTGKPVIEQVRHNNLTAYLENDPTGQPIILRTASGMQSLYIYDHLGSPIALITQAASTAFAYDYDPYGAAELTETTGGYGVPQNPLGYTAGLKDRTTDFTLNGARYYNPTTGNWTQQDALDTPLDPLNANRYTYVAGNPINYIDPLGAYSVKDYLETVGIFASGIGALGAVGGCIVGAVAAVGVGCIPGAAIGAGAGAVAGGAVGIGFGIAEWIYS